MKDSYFIHPQIELEAKEYKEGKKNIGFFLEQRKFFIRSYVVLMFV